MSITSAPPEPILRSSYRPSDYQIETVDLHFELDEQNTRVRSRMAVTCVGAPGTDLVLQGEELTLVSVAVDGEALGGEAYTLGDDSLTLHSPPESFRLEVEVRIAPAGNTALSGLYVSGGNFCTQCEAEGFRRITYFLDRPDVMARYSVTIEGDKERYPIMLSNGNRIATEDLGGGRQRVRWEDPFPKPSYLFALVAGDLACHRGTYRTGSGRDIDLELFVAEGDLVKCTHAMGSLQRAMRWDEEVFGLEYDLDLYMIVAVSDFNMGAMENKGLNIFNSKFVLAATDTATDDDFESVEGVIGHEYFHNWTGNRVTCRDWFQLTLKEGLTVFRDQEFSSDMGSRAVARINRVRQLRAAQYPEDAGPMSHPIRPESYIEMDNFYTATVYNKGAEVIRMIHTIVGADGFRRGMDLYFARHDGQAVTCNDFRAAMADANRVDLGPFEQWYIQSGTPRLKVRSEWDEAHKRLTLTFTQELASDAPPLHIPVRLGLVGSDGRDCPLRLEGEDEGQATGERVLQLLEREQTFVFTDLEAEPLPSVLRGFSAPVLLEMKRSREDLAFLLAHDSDSFNRWDAGQELFGQALLALTAASVRGKELKLDTLLADAFGRVLVDESVDGSLRALALTLPTERELAQQMQLIEPEHLHLAREFLRRALASAVRAPLMKTYAALAPTGPYTTGADDIHRRRLRNCALSYLTALAEDETTALAWDQFQAADNMTDSQAALACLVELDVPQRAEALAKFHDRWAHDALVIDKWFTVQAASSMAGGVRRMRELASHPDFSLANPNRARSLLFVFPVMNPAGFHQADGSGYTFLADNILAIDANNPQLAARLVGPFLLWRRYDQERGDLMKSELERLRSAADISKNTLEIVTRALS
jgi:aminopeptidase N